MRSIWNQIPMLRIALALTAGIGLEIGLNQWQLSQIVLWPAAFILSMGLIFLFTSSKNIETALNYNLRLFKGIALVFSIASFGYIISWLNTQNNYPSHFSNFVKGNEELLVRIDEPPVSRDKIIMAVASAVEVNNKGHRTETTGKIEISFQKDSSSMALVYGDIIAISGDVRAVEGPKNPGEFDFRIYQSYQNIYQNTYLRAGQWEIIGN